MFLMLTYYCLHQKGGIKPLILTKKIYKTRINFLEMGNTRREVQVEGGVLALGEHHGKKIQFQQF